MIAPVCMAILIVLYFIIYFGLIIQSVQGIFKYLLGIIPLLLSFVAMKVCYERIHEIKEGEEDDLSQY